MSKEECEYCKNGKPIENKTNDYIFINNDVDNSKIIEIEADINEYRYNCYFKINYCPMCGRKLDKE